MEVKGRKGDQRGHGRSGLRREDALCQSGWCVNQIAAGLR